MKSAKYVLREYQSLGIAYGSEVLLDHQQALRFLDDCVKANLVILGMDFYRGAGDSIMPVEASADYSSLSEGPEAVARSVQAAKKLINDGLPDGAAYVSFVVEVRERSGNRRMTTPRMGPGREDLEWWIASGLADVEKRGGEIAAGQATQETYTGLYLDYMTLGRAYYLNGTWFLHRNTVKEARASFQKAAECIEMSFRMAYDPTLPEYLGDHADWARVMETDALDGFTAAFMASDFALARRFAPWPRRSPGNIPMDEEVCSYANALQAYLLNDAGTATQLLRRNLDKFKQRPSSKGVPLNYHTLSMALLGIVEKNETRFNGGLAAQLEFYERFETGVNSKNEDTAEEWICDQAVALANLGLWAGLKLQAQHRLLPTALLISTHKPLSR